jgi:hypothetical protein
MYPPLTLIEEKRKQPARYARKKNMTKFELFKYEWAGK